MSKQQVIVTVNTSMFGFQEGEAYHAVAISGGWQVQDASGNWIMLPPNIVQQIDSPAQVITPEPVQAELSAVEEKVLEQALNNNTATKAQQAEADNAAGQQNTPSILSQIMDNDNAAPEEPIFQSAAEALVKEVEDEELKRKRELLNPPAQPLLKEGQCWLTDLTEGTLPDSGVDAIITVYAWDHFPEPLRQDIPEFDIYHEWDANVLENIVICHEENIKNLLVGMPGAGKSSSVKNYAALIRQPFMPLNGKSTVDSSSFLGFLWANTNGTEFSEGLLPVAMRAGYLLCIDEVFKIPADIQMNFQTVYQEDGFLLLDEKPGNLHDKLVKPHPDFRLMSTDNVKGTGENFDKFGATQAQDSSTLDRFGLPVNVDYLPQEKEVEALKRMYPEVKYASLERFVRVANMVREAYGKGDVALTLSMRGLKTMARLVLKRGFSESTAYSQVYLAKLANEEEINTATQFSSAVGLSDNVPLKSPAQAEPHKTEDKQAMPWESKPSTDPVF